MENQFIVSASPHIKIKDNSQKIMFIVNISLLPAVIASVYLYGLNSLILICLSVFTCVITEIFSQKILGKKITVSDGSAILTGILLAFNVPPTLPWWMIIIGAFASIFLVKQLFGGLGYNIFNPALAARAILLASFPVQMTNWTKPVFSFFKLYTANQAAAGPDAFTSASPLGIVKLHLDQKLPTYLDLLFGKVPGSLGETCKIALIIGGLILIIFKIIDFRIPVIYIGSVFLLTMFFNLFLPIKRDPVFEILSGGLILGAFFMATDMVTAPTTGNGKIIFALGCGLITALIRNFGGFPEGVCYSILFMNCLTPLIDKYIKPKIFGTARSKA